MSDGVEVALTIYYPDAPNDGPFPAVVESVPYRKDDDCFARDWITYQYLASRGFAGVRIDIRGTGASGGVIENEYVDREQQDTLEVLAWLAAQEWCSGRLGMWGISWGGFSALQTAMLRPPGLQAIAAAHATHDRFAADVHYYGGALHLLEQVDWPTGMVALNGLPPDPKLVGADWRALWTRRLEQTPQWPIEWLRHQQRDAYWLHGSPCADYGSITAATLLFGGWLDGYVDGILAMLERLGCRRRAVVGPWGHYRPADGVPGPTYDHLREMARWFGHWLRDDPNGADGDPMLTAYIRTGPPFDHPELPVPGFWRHYRVWPPEDQGQMTYYLHETSLGESPGGEATRAWSGPYTVGLAAPQWDPAGWGTGDTSDDDRRSLTFETEPLDRPLEILGAPATELEVSVDQPYGHLAVRLVDVAPGGSCRLITRGYLNLAFRRSLSEPQPVRPHVRMSVRVEMRSTSALIAPGHRLRLSVSGADFPLAWPPPGPLTMTLHLPNGRLLLPVVADSGEVAGISPAPIRSAPVETLVSSRHREVKAADGAVRVTRGVAGRERQPDLVFASHQEIEVDLADGDPLACRAWSKAVVELERPGWQVATEGTLELTCDESHLFLTIRLVARDNGEAIFHRTWHEAFPRTWV